MSDALLDSLLAGGPVKVIQKSEYFAPGSGLVVLRKLIMDGPTASGGTGKFEKPTFVAEWQIITSEPSGDLNANGQPIQPNPPGAIVGFIQHPGAGEAGRVAPGKIKMVVLALAGISEEEGDLPITTKAKVFDGEKVVEKEVSRAKWAELLARFKDKSQPGTGMVCRYRAALTATKEDRNKGLPKHLWHTFPQFESYPQSDENVAKLAKIISEGGRVTPADLG